MCYSGVSLVLQDFKGVFGYFSFLYSAELHFCNQKQYSKCSLQQKGNILPIRKVICTYPQVGILTERLGLSQKVQVIHKRRKKSFLKLVSIFNTPGVTGDVSQTASLTDKLNISPSSSKSLEHLHSQSVTARELKF